MARVTCAISGIQFSCDHLPIVLTEKCGYIHPVFAIPRKKLYGIYSKHCKNHLTHTDSYLLFLALIHSTGQVEWAAPARLDPEDKQTVAFIENNVGQLLRVIELTDAILTPAFKQPSFAVREHSDLTKQLPSWIAAWRDNIANYERGYASDRERDSLVKIENKLSYLIKSGLDPKSYAKNVAEWASRTACFPDDVTDEWERIIRSCFNSEKMFSTPLATLKEIKAYCEENIEAGSIHFHALQRNLREGIARHTDFLGLSPAHLGYTLMPIDSTKNDAELESIKAAAPTSEPVESDYPSKVAYLRAKLRYRVAKSVTAQSVTPTEETI